MTCRPAIRCLALIASLITAVLPPAVVARTVCEATGRAVVTWVDTDGCALAAVAAPPGGCDHCGDDDRLAIPGEAERGCCSTTPALAATAQPDVDSGCDDSALPIASPDVQRFLALPPAASARATSRRATGPPGHALRRHLRARRAVVLTI